MLMKWNCKTKRFKFFYNNTRNNTEKQMATESLKYKLMIGIWEEGLSDWDTHTKKKKKNREETPFGYPCILCKHKISILHTCFIIKNIMNPRLLRKDFIIFKSILDVEEYDAKKKKRKTSYYNLLEN